MSTLQLKVCGMRDPQNILEVAEQKPEYMGFIFYAASPRFVGDDFEMPEFAHPIRKVGVFVNEDAAVVSEKARTFRLDAAQLHGHETPEQCAEIKRAGIDVIKVFSVDDETDFSVTEAYTAVADYFLFDTKGRYYGGNAKTFNWEILHRYQEDVPFFLSGGLTPAHIPQVVALRHRALIAIDVNSGVEVRPALKDAQQVKLIKTMLNR